MKFYISNFDLDTVGHDGTLARMLEPLELASIEACDAVIIPFTWSWTFQFEDDRFASVLRHKKPVVVLDYVEHQQIHKMTVMGRTYCEETMGVGYRPMHEAMRELERVLYFKRELPADNADPSLLPCDFCHYFPDQQPQSRGDYYGRKVELLYTWGPSNFRRPAIHGALMAANAQFAWNFAFEPRDIDHWLTHPKEHGGQHLAALFDLPYWRRIPLDQIMEVQGRSQVSLSMFGNGRKCFRSAEAGYNSLMCHQGVDTVKWSYPWIDAQNCINLPSPTDTMDLKVLIDTLDDWLRKYQQKLYDIYLAGVANNRLYRADRYLNDYLLPKIGDFV